MRTKKTEKALSLETLLRNPHNYMRVRKHAVMLIDERGAEYGPIGPFRKDEAEHKAREYGWPDYRVVDAPQAEFHDGIGWDPEWTEAKNAGWQMVQDRLVQTDFVDESEVVKWVCCDGNVYTLFWDGVIEYLETHECHKMLDHIRRKLSEAYAACFPTYDTGVE